MHMQENPELRSPDTDTRHWLPKSNRESRVMERKTVQANKEKTVTEVELCPLIEAWKKMGKSKEEMRVLCDISMFLDEGFSEEYPITIKTSKRLGWGDRCCEFIFEKDNPI